MKLTIYKYQIPLEDRFTIDLPSGAHAISVAVQRGVPCIWAIVDTDAPTKPHKFALFGTGHPLPDVWVMRAYRFVGTFMLRDGDLVFHLFSVPDVIGL